MKLLLLSGGMDSALLLHKYGADLCVGFDYGQPHAVELQYAERLAATYSTRFLKVPLPGMSRIDDVVFAGRNAVLLSVGASIAHAEGMDHVVIGCNFSDAQRFSDCRPEFIRSMNAALKSAYGVSVHAPFLTTTKAQIRAEVESLGLRTWTCYSPRGDQACGECYSCEGLRRD